MKLQFIHHEGARIPTGWAVSHRDFMRQVTICYPIGIHFIVRWSRNLFYWLMSAGYPSWRQTLEHKIYLEGMLAERKYHKGLEQAAYRAGQEEAGIKNIEAVIKKMREEDDDD